MQGNCYSLDEYKLIPIRYEDRLDVMRWRNEQIYHLRQKELLTEEQQDKYFKEVVRSLFDEEYPSQILFSYLDGEKCIGYGGLVHIDWQSKNAEISFIMDTTLESKYFNLHWKNYLTLLYKYAFEELNLHKIYTYAFDIRPYLYKALEEGGLVFEAKLKEYFLFEGEYKDVVIHSKLNSIL
jgi:RimJ/RimL family protein N-acetyltransferase